MKNFALIDLPNGDWAVSWPNWAPVKDMTTKDKLINVAFDHCASFQVGFGILLNNGEMDILWVDYTVKDEIRYHHYMTDMYEIGGCVFRTENEAVAFRDELEKRATWYYLKA